MTCVCLCMRAHACVRVHQCLHACRRWRLCSHGSVGAHVCACDWFRTYVHVVWCEYTLHLEFYREELCVGEENVEVNYAFFKGEGCIYVSVHGRGMGASHCMCTMFSKWVWVCLLCVIIKKKTSMQLMIPVCVEMCCCLLFLWIGVHWRVSWTCLDYFLQCAIIIIKAVIICGSACT